MFAREVCRELGIRSCHSAIVIIPGESRGLSSVSSSLVSSMRVIAHETTHLQESSPRLGDSFRIVHAGVAALLFGNTQDILAGCWQASGQL